LHVFATSASAATSALNIAQSVLEIQSAGNSPDYLHVIDTSPFAEFSPPVFDASRLASNTTSPQGPVGIRLLPAMLGATCNAPYPEANLSFLVSHRSDLSYNPIIADPFYRSMLVYPFKTRLNNFIDTNTIRFPIQNATQVLEYSIDANSTGASHYADRIVSLTAQVQPVQSFVFGPSTTWLNTYDFRFTILGEEEQIIMETHFTHSNINFQLTESNMGYNTDFNISSGTYAYAKFIFNQWGTFTFVTRDSDNNNHPSLYVNESLLTGTKEHHASRNLLRGTSIPAIDFSRARKVRLSTNLRSPLNFYENINDRTESALSSTGCRPNDP